jgi:3-oxoacyl-[acyl-carrier-protein] synthase II
MERRVVITGIGMVSPAGHTFEDTIAAVRRGHVAGAAVRSFDATGFGVARAAQVVDFDARPHCRVPKVLKLTDRSTQLAIAASAMARAAAGWPDDETSSARLGVLIGLNGCDLQATELANALRGDGAAVPVDDIPVFADHVLGGLNPLWLLVSVPNMPSAHAAIQLGARGPNSSLMTDWIAGSQAIGEAADWIRTGEADAVLAGGTGTMLHPFALAAYQQAGLFDNADACFFVPGEGSAVVFLEALPSAEKRGAAILAEVVGYASTVASDGNGISALAQTMSAALREAGWQSDDVGAVAMASVEGSAARVHEDAAITEALGAATERIWRADFQPSIGHGEAALGPSNLCLLIASAPGSGGLLCNAAGLSGQALTLAIAPWKQAARE